MTYPKQAVTSIVKDIIETFGDSKYKEYTLASMKLKIKDITKQGFDKYKEETGSALTSNTYGHVLTITLKLCDKARSVESLLTKITEFYLTLTE